MKKLLALLLTITSILLPLSGCAQEYYTMDVPERGTLEYFLLAINAQTGEMQDYRNNKDDSDDYIGFIPWDEVGVQN